MKQSNVIFAFLLVAFLIFITMRGELPTYIGFLVGAGVNTDRSALEQSTRTPTTWGDFYKDPFGAIQHGAANARGTILDKASEWLKSLLP